MTMRLGTAKVEITPSFAVPLAGYSNRKGVYESVFKPLYVRAWLFEQTDTAGGEPRTALLIQADLIWWGSEQVDTLKGRIHSQWHIKPERVFFQASHTHGGPQTTDHFSPLLGLMDAKYIDFLEHAVEQAIAEAHANREAVFMEKGVGNCEGLGVNRRKIENGKADFAPNPEGTNDHSVTVIRCVTETGRMKGFLFQFTCHPTTTGINRISSHYCGAAMELLDRRWGSGSSCFLQGCCGDIRPDLQRDGRFYNGAEEDIERLGAVLAEAVETILNKPMLRLESAPIEGWVQSADLLFQDISLSELTAEDEVEAEAVEAWHRLLATKSSNPNGIELKAKLLRLAEGFALMGFNGEIVLDYGLWIKSKCPDILPLGYSNGMIGYVPTARQIAEGGYESISSGYYFGYPAPFATDVEARMKEVIELLMEKLNEGTRIR